MTLLAVRESKAAAMLDLPVSKFTRLVSEGALPPPVRIGGETRWRVDDLRAILSGQAARPSDDFE